MPYAKIGTVTFIPYIATPGQSVAGTIILENPLSEGALAVSVDVYRVGAGYLFSLAVTPSQAWVLQNGSAQFSTIFSMPNYDIEVWVFSWAWLELEDIDGNPTGEWGWFHHETAGPISIKLSSVPSVPPALTDLNVCYRKKMATLSLPVAAPGGSMVNGILTLQNFDYDAQFQFTGYWTALLSGVQGPVYFLPIYSTLKNGEMVEVTVAFFMPYYEDTEVRVTINRLNLSTGIMEYLEQEGPLVVHKL